MSRFSQLIDEVADQKNHTLTDVLLKAKVLGHRLRSRSFRQWLQSELDGYPDKSPVPDYRQLRASLQGDFVGHFDSEVRNVPLSTSFLEPDVREVFERESMRKSVAYLEDLVASKGVIGKSLDISAINYMRKHGEQIPGMKLNHIMKSIPKQSFMQLLTSVRSRLLGFLLDLRDKYPDLETDDDATGKVRESDIDAAMDGRIYHGCTIIEGTGMRDIYQAGQAGAMGPDAKAENVSFVQVLREATATSSLADLAQEIATLRTALLPQAVSAEQDYAIAALANAEEAAKKGDAKGVLGWLKASGKWALDAATKIGTDLAAKAMEKAMHMP